MQNSFNVTSCAPSTQLNRDLERADSSSNATNLSSLSRVNPPLTRRREDISSMRLPSHDHEVQSRILDKSAHRASNAFRLSHKQQLVLCSIASAATTSILHFKFGAMSNNRAWIESKVANNVTNFIPELDAPEGAQKGCALPTSYGGWHSGKFLATLQQDNGWTWQACATECAKLEACVSWTLPVHAHSDTCVLLAEKGEYHETGYHVEGDRDINCLNTQAPSVGQDIKQIYYINLEKNKIRRQSMEKQLGKQEIPFHRINALAGNKSHACSGDIGGPGEGKCRGVAGLALSNLQIIDHGDHSQGFSLVLEDDVYVRSMDVLMSSVHSVPKDWDIIRWNCIPEQYIPATFERVNKYVFRTFHEKPCEPTQSNAWCNFYGGTYAMLWKNTSLPKLRDVWSQEPFTDIDGRLNTEKLKSYCVDIGDQVMHQPPDQEMSDIQVNESGNVTIQWN